MTPTFPDFDPAALDPILTADQIALLRRFGETRATTDGEVIWSAGERHPSLVVVLSGRVRIIDRSDGHDRTILEATPGQFLGELNLLTGQIAWANCEVQEGGEVLIVPSDRLRTVIATAPTLGDILVITLALRRKALIFAAGNTLTLIGPPTSQSLLRVAEFVDRNRIPFRWLAPDDPVGLELLGRAEPNPYAHVWVIVRDQTALAEPTPLRVAKALGLDLAIDQTEPADLIVVGAGPAGLSAAVYGASEGLSTIVVDSIAIGGQAAASSRIENYLGFPAGISGGDLAFLAEVQALKFGARITVPNNAVALRRNGEHVEIELENGKSLRARSVVLATGARYRTLGLPRENDLAGIYYAATDLEARLCSDRAVVVVGGGNSAGQAAMFLSERSPHVYLVHRQNELESSMSQYLIARLKKTRNISPKLGCTITELDGSGPQLRGVTIQGADGAAERVATNGLFVMIGADPCTEWLRGSVELDEQGFVLTGIDLPHSSSGGHRPIFATSEPGVFAVGDARSGSVKRVASAVGEGSVVIQQVHRYLASTPITVSSS